MADKQTEPTGETLEAAGDVKMEPADTKEPEPEKPKELEEDAPADKRAKLQAEDATFLTEDTTLNVMPISGGELITSLSDGGFQYLLAGARASVGVKAGRYMFEVTVVEKKNPSEPQGAYPGPKPRQLVRVGFATAGSSLFLPEGGVCFDAEGMFLHGKDRKKAGQPFRATQVMGVVLNLDPASPNADTMSLFCNGKRVSEPQPLPASLKGKVLFPALAFKNVTLQVHFGPQPLRALPFKCRSVLDAAKEDCEVKVGSSPKNGKFDVIFPVGMPDEGTFDWLDQFLSKHPNFVELSDRMILDWAQKSGIPREKGYAWRSSNDKPTPGFGLPLMDDNSIRRVIGTLAPALERNFIIMEVKGNLLAEARQKALARFPSSSFNRICQVRMGDPDDEFKAGTHEAILTGKKAKAEAEARKKRAEIARKKAEEDRRKKAEAAKKAREEAAKKAREARMRKAAGEEEPKNEDAEEKVEEKEQHAEEKVEDEIVAEEVFLTDEDRKIVFRTRETPDVSPAELSSSFSKFTLPDKEEGFDELEFPWQNQEKCQEYLRDWMKGKKMTERVEDLQPSEWFQEKRAEWTKTLGGWQRKQTEFRDPVLKRKAEAAKKKALEEKRAKAKENGEEEPVEEETDVKMDIDADDLDVFSVEDVTDIGNGEPLFARYDFEDWECLKLRYELHLLVHAFRRDLDDAERPSFHENHLSYYYNKYFKKTFSVNVYNVPKLADVIELVKDTVEIGAKSSCLETQLSEDTPLDNFVKLTEDNRRDRARRADAGDETAELKFKRPSQQQASQGRPAAPQGRPAVPEGRAPVSRPSSTVSRPSSSQPSYYGQKRPSSGPSSYGSAPKASRSGDSR